MADGTQCAPEKAFATNDRLLDMPYPREILNRLKWKEGSLKGVKVTYVHRGAPGDTLTIAADDIVSLGHSFFATADSEIPYHRILSIDRDGEVLFDLRDYDKKEDDATGTGGERV
jgi:uncharacterized protein